MVSLPRKGSPEVRSHWIKLDSCLRRNDTLGTWIPAPRRNDTKYWTAAPRRNDTLHHSAEVLQKK